MLVRSVPASFHSTVMSLRRRILTAVKSSMETAGVSISRYPPPDSYERHLQEYFRQMQINCVLDVGAYDGRSAAGLRAAGFKGLIISFEPVPASWQQLQKTMGNDPLWVGQPFGLSSASRKTVINTYDRGVFNSLLTLKADAEDAYSLDKLQHGQVEIELRRLDEIMDGLIAKVSSPNVFVKIDTQGHDVDVIRGAAGCLSKITGFQSEVPAVQIYEGMPSMTEALEFYQSCGFVPIGFYPVNTFNSARISPEFDVLFTRFAGSLTQVNGAGVMAR